MGRLAYSFHTWAGAWQPRPFGLVGWGQRATAPSDLGEQAAFPAGNASTCSTLTYFSAFPEDQEYEAEISVEGSPYLFHFFGEKKNELKGFSYRISAV